MKRCLTVLCVLLGTVALATTSARAATADGDFTKTLTAAELAATGLAKLSPEELAQLKSVVERYKAGAVEVVQQQAETKVAAAETKVVAAETKIAAAEAKAKQAEQTTVVDKKKPGWLHALITLEKSTGNAEQDGVVESRIAGDFTGWSGKTIFRLENGQVWQQTNAGEYVTSAMPSPSVKIFPAKFGGFWLVVDGVNPRVRVKPIKLE